MDRHEVGPDDLQRTLDGLADTVSPDPVLVYLTDPAGEHKTRLLAALAAGCTGAGQPVCLVSRQTQADLVLAELEQDDSDFVEGGVDPGTLLQDWLARCDLPELALDLARELGLAACLGRGIKYLSTGELRKAMLARAAATRLAILAGDELLEGLDAASRQAIPSVLARACQTSTSLVLVELALDTGVPLQVAQAVAAARHCPVRSFHLADPGPGNAHRLVLPLEDGASGSTIAEGTGPGSPLVVMRQVQVVWDDQPVLKDFDWVLWPGEHTFVQGPNGCGKSSLLRLITGDNPQVYANHVEICGLRRGTGESIWDVTDPAIKIA